MNFPPVPYPHEWVQTLRTDNIISVWFEGSPGVLRFMLSCFIMFQRTSVCLEERERGSETDVALRWGAQSSNTTKTGPMHPPHPDAKAAKRLSLKFQKQPRAVRPVPTAKNWVIFQRCWDNGHGSLRKSSGPTTSRRGSQAPGVVEHWTPNLVEPL